MASESSRETVRFRVTFPKPVYERLEAVADKLGLDVPLLVRLMASLQLSQWELTYFHPDRMLNLPHIRRQFEESAKSAFPELEVKS